MTLQFTEDLLTGFSIIDEKHKMFIEKFNVLLDSFRTNSSEEVIDPLFDFLTKYVKEHFLEEETLMFKYAYSGYGQHKIEHQHISEKLEKIKDEYSISGANMSNVTQMTEFLLRWFIDHIKRSDMQYKAYIEKKAKPAAN
ncbi:MAG: hemerythrin family protein [Desulfuromonadales bacterium]|nr:hemerythrin family protein [Desulfuromonadales bacterium]